MGFTDAKFPVSSQFGMSRQKRPVVSLLYLDQDIQTSKSEGEAVHNIENAEKLSSTGASSFLDLDSIQISTLLRSFLFGRAGHCVSHEVGLSSNYSMQAAGQELHYVHLKTCLPLENHARNVMTPFTFNALQQELILSMQYAASEMANGSYHVRHFKKMSVEHLIIWTSGDEQIHCSCKEFE